MLKLKMYFRFVLWLVKKLFGSVGPISKFLSDVLEAWKDAVRNDFMLSVLFLLIVEIVSLVTSLVIWCFVAESPRTQGPTPEHFIVPLISGLVIYFCVILLALYDIFIEEYEEPFELLKKDHHGH